MAEPHQLSILDERRPRRELTFGQKFFVLIGVLFGVCVLLFGLFVFTAVRSERDRGIYGELVLAPEWVEITPDKPLSFPKRSQGIIIEVVEPLAQDGVNWERVRLTDGTLIRPELQLVERDGSVTDVELLRGHSNIVGGHVRRLPEGRVYTKVRVRCDRPLRVSRIVWRSWDGK